MGYRIITTVVTAATSGDLATLADVKAELGITDGGQDVLIKRYISAASMAVEQFCNRRFAVETVTDEVWPDQEFYSFQVAGSLRNVQLSRWPVVSVGAVTENGETLTEADGDFRIDKASGTAIRIDGNGYPKDWLAWPLRFTYSGGYSEIPLDVADATIRLVKARYVARGRDPFLKSESIPGVRDATWWVATGSDAGNMPPDVADILENYRQPVVM